MDRKPILPAATSSLASLAPLAGSVDLRGWLHQVASEVDQLRERVATLEARFKTVSEQGDAHEEKLVALKGEIDAAKEALATYSETLGKIMAAQSSFEKSTIAELRAIKGTVVGSAIEQVAQTDKMATKKAQVWAVVVGAVSTAFLNTIIDWLTRK